MKIPSFTTCIGLIFVILFTHPLVFGQKTDSLKYASSFQIGGQRKTGVFSQTALRVTSKNKLEKGKFAMNNFSSYTYTTVNGMNIANDWDFRTILTYKKDSSSRILPAIAHNFHSNVLYRIRNSHRAIAGIRILPFKKPHNFSFLLGAGYELSNYSGEVFLNSPAVSNTREFALGFINVNGKHVFGKHKLLLEYNLSFVQSIKEINDRSIWFTPSISLPLSKKLLVGLSYDFRFRNVHLEVIPQTNDLLILNVKVNLSK